MFKEFKSFRDHDPLLALLAKRRLVFRGGGVAAVIDRSPDEERVLAELTDLDARFSRAREALRLGRPVTLSE